jgi:NitT/TauT family transport system substrate-binding protein
VNRNQYNAIYFKGLKHCYPLALCVLTLSLAQLQVGFAQALRPMIVSVSSPREISAAPMLLAKHLGFFKEEGLDLRFVVMSSDIAMKGLITGDLDFAASVSSVIRAAAVGIPVKTVMNFFDGSFFYLMTKPEIAKVDQLRNKTIAISRYGSATDFDTRGALRHFGLDPAKDVSILAVGGGTARIAGLISGRVDAALLNNVEKLAAEKAGMKALIFTGQYVKQPVGGLGASVQRLKERRDEIRRGLKATFRAAAVMQKERNRTKAFLVEVLDVKSEYADGIYEDMLKVFLPSGKIDLKHLAGSYDEARKQSNNPPPVPLNALVDYSLLDEIQASPR